MSASHSRSRGQRVQHRRYGRRVARPRQFVAPGDAPRVLRPLAQLGQGQKDGLHHRLLGPFVQPAQGVLGRAGDGPLDAARRADAERKPYAPREAAPRKPYAPKGDSDRKPYAPRAEADRKPYVRRDDAAPPTEGAKKPRWTPDDRASKGAARDDSKPAYKSAGYKSQGGSDARPARATGYKSHAADGKPAPRGDAPEGRKPWAGKGEEARPYAKREGAADKRGPKPEGGRSWGTKSAAEGDKKPYAAKGAKPFARKPGAKPAAPKTDARDTSKRFAPPKKPKS